MEEGKGGARIRGRRVGDWDRDKASRLRPDAEDRADGPQGPVDGRVAASEGHAGDLRDWGLRNSAAAELGGKDYGPLHRASFLVFKTLSL